MSTVLIDDSRGIRTITLNRPVRRNALTPELISELTAALRGAEAAGARVVVLRGAGEAFSAGLDLDVLRASLDHTSEQLHADAERVNQMFRALWDCPMPTVALVHGAAVAGGAGLATICDFTLATPEAKFGFTEARIGFVPALVSVYLSLNVGDKIARDLLLTARLVTAEEAHRIGLVTELVSSDELDCRAAELIQQLLANSPASLRATKQLLREQHEPWFSESLARAMDANAAARRTGDFREGISAFLEKRKPSWNA